MNKKLFSWQLFSRVPIIGIIRNLSFEEIRQILPLFHDAGLTSIEITMNTRDAEKIISYAVDHYSENMNIGAGTVCSEDDLHKAIAAGAQFIVTPIINGNVIQLCVEKEIPIFPGAFTPTEVYKAWSMGASMVKIFPATSVGPAYIKELKGPLNQVKLLPTGGVTLDNIESFKEAGSDGFGIGSQLFNKAFIKEKKWERLKSHFQEFVKKVHLGSE